MTANDSCLWFTAVAVVGVALTLGACGGDDIKADRATEPDYIVTLECEGERERECVTACGVGRMRCVDGYWGVCRVADAGPCVEPMPRCVSGQTRSCPAELGQSPAAMQQCIDGQWGACFTDENDDGICDAGAENCSDTRDMRDAPAEDSMLDAGTGRSRRCGEGTSRQCGTQLGQCAGASQDCLGGEWSPCSAAPSVEICDGEDNDCDGDVDETFDIGAHCALPGQCPGVKVCGDDASTTECRPDPSRYGEEACDGEDNDCDGLVDQIVQDGAIVSVCVCDSRSLAFTDVLEESISNDTHLCAPTECSGGQAAIRGLAIDGTCWPLCESTTSDTGGGWGYEDGHSCLLPQGEAAGRAVACTAEDVAAYPTSAELLSIRYCLDCNGEEPGPFAMCQSPLELDLREFGRGERWLRVRYSYDGEGVAQVPVNLWFRAASGPRKYLPLVRVGDAVGTYERLMRVHEACFSPSAEFGNACTSGNACDHCYGKDVCGNIADCGTYDLRGAQLQVAAEFCSSDDGEMPGSVTIHQVELVTPACIE